MCVHVSVRAKMCSACLSTRAGHPGFGRGVGLAVKWLTDLWNKIRILKQVACCDLQCKHISNTGFSKSLCLAFVNTRTSKQPECTIEKTPTPLSVCLNRFGSAVGRVQSAGVRAAGESTAHLFHLLFLQIFTHPMCNQLDVWLLGIMCHTDSP